MFNTLNRFIARLDAAPQEPQRSNQGAAGFQVLRNKNPDVPLEPWFDFVIGINGRSIVDIHFPKQTEWLLILDRIAQSQACLRLK